MIGGGGGGLEYKKGGGARRLDKGCKFQIWISLRVLKKNRQYRLGLHVKKCSIFLNSFYFRGQKMREPRPDWSPLGVNFKIFDEHPHLFYIRVPPPRAVPRPSKFSPCKGDRFIQ